MSAQIDFMVGVGRILAGAILLIAGIAKVRDTEQNFFRAVSAYELVPHDVARLVAFWLPTVEVTAGIFLVLGLFPQTATAIGAALLILFAGAVGVSLLRGKQQPCGCFRMAEPVRWGIVTRNSVLASCLIVAHLRGGGGLHFELSMIGHPESFLWLSDPRVILGSWLVLILGTWCVRTVWRRFDGRAVR